VGFSGDAVNGTTITNVTLQCNNTISGNFTISACSLVGGNRAIFVDSTSGIPGSGTNRIQSAQPFTVNVNGNGSRQITGGTDEKSFTLSTGSVTSSPSSPALSVAFSTIYAGTVQLFNNPDASPILTVDDTNVTLSKPLAMGGQGITGASAITASGAVTAGSLSLGGGTNVTSAINTGSNNITTNANIILSGATGTFGYGVRGAVSQPVPGPKNGVNVTLHNSTGTIVTGDGAILNLVSNGTAAFTLFNNAISETDFILIQHISGGINMGKYNINAVPNVGGGSAIIQIRNISASSLSESLTLRFVVIKS
jgi:hypothetical protein